MPLTARTPSLACCRGASRFASLSRAAAKAAGARLRNLGVLPTRVDWTARAAACERCPLRVVECGRSYCGTPFVRKVDRDPAVDGCGCPTHAKAKDPAEHCPLNSRNQAASSREGVCDCKWCAIAKHNATSRVA